MKIQNLILAGVGLYALSRAAPQARPASTTLKDLQEIFIKPPVSPAGVVYSREEIYPGLIPAQTITYNSLGNTITYPAEFGGHEVKGFTILGETILLNLGSNLAAEIPINQLKYL